MTYRPALATAQSCLERAVAMQQTAQTLRNQGDEWFAVCYFYAAYHVVRAAMLDDPIFSDLARLATKSPHLTLGDRFATRHHGYIVPDGRVMGVNDIVTALYPHVAVEYRRLHVASIEVRYGEGLGVIAEASVVSDYEHVIGEYKALRLTA